MPNQINEIPLTDVDVDFDLPAEIRRILGELQDGDEVEIVRCPDTGKITFNIVNEFNDSDIISWLRRIYNELRTISANTRIFRDDNNSGGSNFWDFISDMFGGGLLSGFGDLLNGVGGLIDSISGLLDSLVEAIERLLIRLFVPRTEKLEEMFDIIKDDFGESVGIENIQAFLDGFQRLADVENSFVLGETTDKAQTFDVSAVLVNQNYDEPTEPPPNEVIVPQNNVYERSSGFDVFSFELFGTRYYPLESTAVRDVFAWGRMIIRVLFYFLFLMVCYRRIIWVLNNGSTFERGESFIAGGQYGKDMKHNMELARKNGWL
jgi:hypothetical protein